MRVAGVNRQSANLVLVAAIAADHGNRFECGWHRGILSNNLSSLMFIVRAGDFLFSPSFLRGLKEREHSKAERDPGFASRHGGKMAVY